MTRAFILVLDSFGIGGAPDAAAFGDEGADTLGHIADACGRGEADAAGRRAGPLKLPNLARLGLGLAAAGSTGRVPPGLECEAVAGAHGHAVEVSRGKDTPSGHWEIAGLPVDFDWGYFPKRSPCFPPDVVAALIEAFELPGILGDKHASGTDILRELGEAHIASGKLICYTSADSVFQIAAHEKHFGLERLYRVCETAKRLLLPFNIGRVIARPFLGERAADFRRTANRRDYTTPPHGKTLLDHVVDAGGAVVSIGKIADIFAGHGISRKIKAENNNALFEATLRAANEAGDGDLVFTNLVDFDMLYGHRRDVVGYATALEDFDARLPNFEARLRPGDLALITADHGCDPTWPGTDHTREQVPALFFGPGIGARDLGRLGSFADMGQTLAAHLGTVPLADGRVCFAP